MLGTMPNLARVDFLAEGAAPVLHPALILLLCLGAGIGTVLLLPARRERSWRGIGAAIVAAVGLIAGALIARSSAAGAGVYFWIFAAVAVIGALRVITHPRPVYSALYFVLTVLASAGLFVLLWAEFMAAALVLIYAGAILITYVFVIMLAAQATPEGIAEYDAHSREPILACTAGFALMGVLLFVIFDKAQSLPPGAITYASTTEDLGRYIFNHQIVNLELAGLILTVSMVGAIIIARRRIAGTQSAVAMDNMVGPSTPLDDSPHSIPVQGTFNPRQKEYPET